MKKYIIVEIIPTSIDPSKGDIIQFSALKIDEFSLLDRFDYRLKEENICFPQFLDIISYDKDKFTYVNSTKDIMGQFEKWSENLPVLYIDNAYTKNYLKNIKNKKKSIFSYLNLEYHDKVIEEIIEKYHLEPSNYIVDLLFEALLFEYQYKNKE